MAVTKHAAFVEMCRRDPMFFRSNLLVDGLTGPSKFGPLMSPVQKQDFTALDPALKYLTRVGPKADVAHFWLQRSRGYSKTTDRASDVLYALTFCPYKLDAVVAAEDREQALLIREQMLKILQYNEWLYEFIDVQRQRIVNKKTNATLNSLSRDTASSFGLTPELVIADEFTHWTQEGFWESLISSAEKTEMRGGVVIIACNAGWGTDWKYRVKEEARTSPEWYYSAPHGPAPWYNKSAIDRQRRILSPSQFGRLWMNEWQASSGEFVSQEEAEACESDDVKRLNGTFADGRHYYAAVDYAEKKDRCVGVVTELYDGEIRVVRMDVVDPETMPDKKVPISWVENWMLQVNQAFGGQHGHVSFVIDDYQLLYVRQRLESMLDIETFEFAAGKGNWEMAVILRSLIVHRKVKWYRNCGTVYGPNNEIWQAEKGRDDLVSELAKLIVKKTGTSSNARWRFDHVDGEHDDRAFALGAVCRHIVMGTGGLDEWVVSQPLTNNGEFSF